MSTRSSRPNFAVRAIVVFGLLCVLSAAAAAQSFTEGHVKLSEVKTSGAKTELEKWREDLDFIKKMLPERHPDLFHRMDKKKFYSEIEKLDKELPGMSADRAAIEFERIVGLAHDGHTYTSPLYYDKSGFHIFPYALYSFSDGMFVRKAAPELRDILGAKVLGIGKYPIDKAYDIVAPYMSSDNEMFTREYVPKYLGCPELLYELGISPDPDKVTLKLEKDGKVFTREVSLPEGEDNTIPAVRKRIKDWLDARDSAPGETPLDLRNEDQAHWFRYVPDKKVLYVQMKDVLDGKDETLKQFWARVFAEADAKKPDKLVVDIRFNGGGNNTLIRPIIRGIIQHPELDREGHLFVIIGRVTFSAAQNLTNMFEKWTNAVFVGEPTGSHVNMYGDAVGYELPNSKMPLRISSLFWQNMHARDERKWRAPQIVAELSFADYVKNIDPAMQAINRPYKKRQSLEEIARESDRADDFEGFRKKVIAYKNDPENKYADIESQINRFGYELIREDRIDTAIKMLQLNVELYPASSNVYDSLGEAYMKKGENALAIKNYEKSLELDPGNTNAVEMIRRIKLGWHPKQ